MRLVERWARTVWSFSFCWRVGGESLRLLVAVRGGYSPWPNAKTSPAESPAAAQRLSRAPSTVSREVARHGGRAQYRANQADQQAWESALRPKAFLLATHRQLQEIVASKLMQDVSPEQIFGWLKQH